ncbi:NAD-dependent succinate-semialdehyde dehydrogenase [Mesorhizobium sp. YC-39]|uniref:NAD-dependent succinate-semialdehyde dehydrogenase n=1 Tax=unclassified Mesorhizobium TaxID=325217 RepID=UPI0021E8E5D8|nr:MULTISPECIES: NAD-dependent succinate-semialdehyde dehydrogenase [unclassified Mesorhizobium]MCV3206560.1 NAD-dependent succinate-semialdehyde dehydrogenase [Mesorhizobium sp. YC-2]MCV3227040.1 NAD-dependent succinate-semialdehyde dehydrogenase [Mesorhizobium sp. YC-39]
MHALQDPSLLRQAYFANGRWETEGEGSILVTNPASGAPVGSVPKASREATRAAIVAAQAALPAWSARPAKERAAVLRRWYDQIVANADDLARILTAEQGKPFLEARGEILYGAAFFEWFAEEAKRVAGEVFPAPTADKRMMAIRQPIGVCAAITPWNFPMAMIPRKAGPAIAAGCTMVLKPASATPFSALALAVLAERAGLPAGVFSVVTGAASVVGEELVTSPIVRKITFTGSTEVGRELMAKAAGTIKKVSLELGGNAPLIVFDDASLETAVQGALASKFRNAGQTCVCANRIYVQDGIYDAFVERFAEVVAALKIGDGMEQGIEQGPLIDEAAVAKVEDHVADALAKGARIVTGGKRHRLGGTFYEPTILADTTPQMRISREETFGPVAPIFHFAEEKEVIALANDTEFGLAAYFFTRDLARAWRVGEALEFGIVGINAGITAYEGAPFGGVKASGIGREGSRHGIEEFLELKYLCLGDMN